MRSRRAEGRRSEELDQAEFVPFGIADDNHDALVVIVAFAREASSEFEDKVLRLAHVVNLDVEVEANLADVGFRHPLERQPGRRIAH